ncbi:MAG TPA: ATPase, T2SS/T4P/T4SS family [Elusimicrobiota bacterium]|jgi:type IV pilus assembly protein PilB|nr:ATPase, T2SS/T4P/T4SS family [Elusimicrobiota bacterium]HMU95529.1 ATPase, T2SS/T4P/T4SS family [Elusimicrobiota bacterium]HMX93670.1 ATPase, T2SS/T4P/T4SS family [Elusimicrobiota bacterium]HMZ26052.1 ATPase, T2SS/T4P/T4SS family [Elusimicrobiota bacterium]HNC74458.1 ATPase, T2SS/T4P/T4SS family [Elusimicrobiota bacterium]
MATRGNIGRKQAKEILIEARLVNADGLAAAEKETLKSDRPLQQIVVDLKLADKVDVLQALSREWRTKAVDLAEMEIDPEVVRILPESTARKSLVLPFAKEDQVLLVAMADPRDFLVSEDIHLRTGLEVQRYLAMPEDILKELDKVYGVGAAGKAEELLKSVTDSAIPEGEGLERIQEKSDVTEVDASAPEVEKIVNAVILSALQMKASDIHIEPFEDPAGKHSKILVRFRVDGFLRMANFQVPWMYRAAVMAKIKIMTNTMNITERRIPQSGRIQVMAKGNPIEFRVEIIPTVYGESCVMRILDRKAVQVDIQRLGFHQETLDKFLGLLKGVGGKKNFGIVVVCGPTGSGKSTTLYAALNHINRPDIKILTAENPVEYNLDGIVQVQVNPDLHMGEDKCFDFATALRSFLRLDPDVIMVGEIRDQETAHIAMEAAMTGHLVFSTIHTNDAPSTVARLVDMGIPSFMVASTVKCVLAQRLCRRVCADCKTARAPTPDEVEVFKTANFPLPANAQLYYGKGCSTCNDSGFKGRCGIHELLVVDDPVRAAVLKDVNADTVREAATVVSPQKMRTIIADGLQKALDGMTTVREVLGGASEEIEGKDKKK